MVIWVYSDFIPVNLTLLIDCSHIEDVHQRRRSRAEFGLVEVIDYINWLAFVYETLCTFFLFIVYENTAPVKYSI